MPPLTIPQRAVVVALRAEKCSLSMIVGHLHRVFGVAVDKATVSRLCRKYTNTGTVERKKGSGRPRLLRERDVNRLARLCIQSPRMTSAELGKASGLGMCFSL